MSDEQELFDADVLIRARDGTVSQTKFGLWRSAEPYYNDAVAEGFSIVVGIKSDDVGRLFAEFVRSGRIHVRVEVTLDTSLRAVICALLMQEFWLKGG